MHDDTTQQERASEPPLAETRELIRLVREHYAPALRYAARLLRDPSEAEDCVQEAFAEAFAGLGSLRDEHAAPAWLRSIVRHRCARRTRRRALELLPSSGELEELHGPAHEPEMEERLEHLALARGLVNGLPRQERAIVVLFYLKDISQREIASFLGLPLSTVNNRLHQARQRMKQWEKHMDITRNDSEAEARVDRIGTIVSRQGPFFEASFAPGAPLELFDAIAVVDGQGRCVERLKVAHRAAEGRALCLPISAEASLEVGSSVLNTGKVGLELTRFGGVRVVPASQLQAAAAALRSSAPLAAQPTGIKAIDLLCPLPARGVVAQAATGGVGRIALLEELAQRLEQARVKLACLCLVDRSEPDAYRGWDETALWGESRGLSCYWALSAQGTDPELGALDECDAALYLSPLLALRGWYPAIDPEHSRSALLRPEIVGAEHCALAARAREELVFLKRAGAEPVLLELLAARAFAAARRRALSHPPRAAGAEALRLERARKLQLFLTQPFEVAREWTGWPGADVPLSETLAGCRAILDGAVDELPEAAFAYAGSLEDVRRHAREGTARQHR